ncbi:hypothetical protein BDR22DRAFT_893036 [Usnea florida]
MAAYTGRPNTSGILVTILDDAFPNKELSAAAHWDENKTPNGVFARSRRSIVKYASQWRVSPGKSEEATADIANAADELRLLSPLNGSMTKHMTVYFAGGAQNPPKQVNFGEQALMSILVHFSTAPLLYLDEQAMAKCNEQVRDTPV